MRASPVLAELATRLGEDPARYTTENLAAVRGMVAGLAARLKSNPDDPQGWVQLVRAYAVLGQAGDRDAALKAANTRYAGKPEVLKALAAAAAAEPMR